jgi:ribonuclease BN (tRNA processing enzyme)
MTRLGLGLLLLALALPVRAEPCGTGGVALQILGSGGPELQPGRTGSSALVWIDGRARLLVGAGPGSTLRFAESGARWDDLEAVLFTRLHADHTADLPALVQATKAENRSRRLPLYGPPGNRVMPSTITFVRDLFDSTRGTYRHLGEFIAPLDKSGYKLEPHDVRPVPPRLAQPRRNKPEPLPVFDDGTLRIRATARTHGLAPALAYRIEAKGKTLVLTGEAGGEADELAALAAGADVLVAHHAITENAAAAARAAYLTPSAIGQLARTARAKQLVLTHRAHAALGREDEALAAIRQHYPGPVNFADDLACFRP